ncbi:unannotated protein [freshwater metagenome]|uniref:Unannotated protein n=1 Tax=freshwater metagenome TaxID=449393 RepID=A0A6J7LSQ1_9ZZZZ
MWQPADIALKEPDLEVGMAFKDATIDHIHDSDLQLERNTHLPLRTVLKQLVNPQRGRPRV